jgi:hypothetical protein
VAASDRPIPFQLDPICVPLDLMRVRWPRLPHTGSLK